MNELDAEVAAVELCPRMLSASGSVRMRMLNFRLLAVRPQLRWANRYLARSRVR